MKKNIATKTAIGFCILFSAIVANTGCKKNLYQEDLSKPNSSEALLNTLEGQPSADTIAGSDEDELVVWQKPGRSRKEYENWRDSISNEYGEVEETFPCGCDSSLMVLNGHGIKAFMSTGGTVSGNQTASTSTKASGDPVEWLKNYRITFSKPNRISSTPSFPLLSGPYSGTTVEVAVIDSGLPWEIRDELNDFLFNSPRASCQPGGDRGWNFVNQTYNYDDDNGHGTTVTKLMMGQINKYRENRVKILPVKVLDKDGSASLLKALCGVIYAAKMGAKVINCSWGVYLPPKSDANDPHPRFLKEFFKEYTTKRNILVVAAAGNQDDVNQKAAFEREGKPLPDNLRNLEVAPFYPAALSDDPEHGGLPNMFAVTTVNKSTRTVAPDQNYSQRICAIGVNATEIIKQASGDAYVFTEPFTDGNEKVIGTSFAAPIFTGFLIARYDKFKHLLNYGATNKSQVLGALSSEEFGTDPGLIDKVKDGRYMRK